MQCKWSSKANAILQNVSRRGSTSFSPPSISWSRSFALQACQSTRSARPISIARRTTLRHASAAAARHDHTHEPTSTTVTEADTSRSPFGMTLSSAQVSRAAAQAARLCMRDSKFGDALYLLNSLHHSFHLANLESMDHPQPPPKSHRPRLEPIDFGQPVSPRLTAHCFLHGLVRAGFAPKASKYAEVFIEQGITIRTHTMEYIISSLSQSSVLPNLLSGGILFSQSRARLDSSNILSLRAGMVSDTHSRAAIHLLQQARTYGQGRSERMYHNIISGTLMQGEIIVASLLFVLLVKDWQTRRRLMEHLGEKESFDAASVEVDERILRRVLRNPYPAMPMMVTILDKIDATLSRDPQDSPDDAYLVPALQALANLATLLDTGQIPFSHVSRLIRALYSCPKTDHRVWILKDEKPCRVEAYRYFHEVLQRLLGSMKHRSLGVQLDRRSYNSLLHYALRHRHSPASASTVLNHMCGVRNPPLDPDIRTFNILIRSGTLLRNMSVSQAALLALQQHSHILSHPVEEGDNLSTLQRFIGKSMSRTSKALTKLATESVDLPKVIRQPRLPVKADATTLSSFITHLTSTGKPQVVADVLFHILPELRVVDHPAWGYLTIEERLELRKRSQMVSLQRAVECGPYVFASILNALQKAGKTGLMERVWLLAKQAELASWNPEFAPGVQPWCMSIHAYTSMLQCYAAEGRKSGPVFLQRLRHVFERQTLDHRWTPRSDNHHRGWAHFVYASQSLTTAREHEISRHEAARMMAKLLYQSMQSGGKAVYKSLMSFQNASNSVPPPNVKLPVPDACFFNAALDLFGHQLHMYPRRARSSRGHWRRRLRFFHRLYEQRGVMSPHWSPILEEIGKNIVAAGYSVPPGFRHIFIGRWRQGSEYQERTNFQLDRRPYAFPKPRDRFHAHSIPTVKSRGLPLPSRCRRRRRMRQCK